MGNLMKQGILNRGETIVQLVNQQSAWKKADKFRKGCFYVLIGGQRVLM
jgi:hypothetical protein